MGTPRLRLVVSSELMIAGETPMGAAGMSARFAKVTEAVKPE